MHVIYYPVLTHIAILFNLYVVVVKHFEKSILFHKRTLNGQERGRFLSAADIKRTESCLFRVRF